MGTGESRRQRPKGPHRGETPSKPSMPPPLTQAPARPGGHGRPVDFPHPTLLSAHLPGCALKQPSVCGQRHRTHRPQNKSGRHQSPAPKHKTNPPQRGAQHDGPVGLGLSKDEGAETSGNISFTSLQFREAPGKRMVSVGSEDEMEEESLGRRAFQGAQKTEAGVRVPDGVYPADEHAYLQGTNPRRRRGGRTEWALGTEPVLEPQQRAQVRGSSCPLPHPTSRELEVTLDQQNGGRWTCDSKEERAKDTK